MLMTKMLLILCMVTGAFAAPNSRIVNGEDVTISKHPHQISLQYDGSHICGGSLIAPNWVVSAAHCTQGPAEMYQVRVGSTNRTSGGPLIDVKRIINHESYNVGQGAYPNDISLLELDYPVLAGKPITLAEGNNTYAGQTCLITGWGRLYGDGPLPEVLQEANTNILSNENCGSEEFWGEYINDGHVCIHNNEEGKTSCNGDSGGPLVCTESGKTKLVGVTSWGPTGCTTYYPAGYSRVSYFRQWIKDKAEV